MVKVIANELEILTNKQKNPATLVMSPIYSFGPNDATSFSQVMTKCKIILPSLLSFYTPMSQIHSR